MIQKQRQPRRTNQEWMDLIQECRISGLSDKEWCEQHSIPIGTFYTKITNLRKMACDIPKIQTHRIQSPQQVVPLPIIDEVPHTFNQLSTEVSNHVPAIVLNSHGYRIEIANHAAKETIIHTLSALQQLC